MSTLFSLRLKGIANYKNWSHFSLAGYVKPKYVWWSFEKSSVLRMKSSPVCAFTQCSGYHLCESWSGWSVWSCGIRVGLSTQDLHQFGWSCISTPRAEPEGGSQYSRRCHGCTDLQVWTLFTCSFQYINSFWFVIRRNKDTNVLISWWNWIELNFLKAASVD